MCRAAMTTSLPHLPFGGPLLCVGIRELVNTHGVNSSTLPPHLSADPFQGVGGCAVDTNWTPVAHLSLPPCWDGCWTLATWLLIVSGCAVLYSVITSAQHLTDCSGVVAMDITPVLLRKYCKPNKIFYWLSITYSHREWTNANLVLWNWPPIQRHSPGLLCPLPFKI